MTRLHADQALNLVKLRGVVASFVILAMVAPPGVLGIIAGLSDDGRVPAAERELAQARLQLRRATVAVQAAFERTGMYPKALVASDGGVVSDPWGGPLWYCAIAGDGVRLRSSGPDQKPGTRDDVFAVGYGPAADDALTCEQPQGPWPPASGVSQRRWGPVHKALLRGTRALRSLFL